MKKLLIIMALMGFFSSCGIIHKIIPPHDPYMQDCAPGIMGVGNNHDHWKPIKGPKE